MALPKRPFSMLFGRQRLCCPVVRSGAVEYSPRALDAARHAVRQLELIEHPALATRGETGAGVPAREAEGTLGLGLLVCGRAGPARQALGLAWLGFGVELGLGLGVGVRVRVGVRVGVRTRVRVRGAWARRPSRSCPAGSLCTATPPPPTRRPRRTEHTRPCRGIPG